MNENPGEVSSLEAVGNIANTAYTTNSIYHQPHNKIVADEDDWPICGCCSLIDCNNNNINTPNIFAPFLTYCDTAMWILCLAFILSLTGFIIVVDDKNKTIALSLLGRSDGRSQGSSPSVPSTSALELVSLLSLTPNVNVWKRTVQATQSALTELQDLGINCFTCHGTTATINTNDNTVQLPQPVLGSQCFDQDGNGRELIGARGKICRGTLLSSASSLTLQIDRWKGHVIVLYFTAMVVTAFIWLLAVLIHRIRAQAVILQTLQQPPIVFYRTPFYGLVMTAWTVISVPVLLFVIQELYQYWTITALWRDKKSGLIVPGSILGNFLEEFDHWFVANTLCVAVFLCWPFFWFVLKTVGFAIGFLPWNLMRTMLLSPAMLQQVNNSALGTVDTTSLSWLAQLDVWFRESQQIWRYGFGSTTWFLLVTTPGSHTIGDFGEQSLPQAPSLWASGVGEAEQADDSSAVRPV